MKFLCAGKFYFFYFDINIYKVNTCKLYSNYDMSAIIKSRKVEHHMNFLSLTFMYPR